MERARKSPELYQRHLIEQDGHVGLELPSEVVTRFERAGFEVESVGVLTDGDVHPRLAVKWFANEYCKVSDELAALVDRSEAILANPIRLAWHEMRLGMRGAGEVERPRLDDALFVTMALRKR
jgi:hypothetical protein